MPMCLKDTSLLGRFKLLYADMSTLYQIQLKKEMGKLRYSSKARKIFVTVQ